MIAEKETFKATSTPMPTVSASHVVLRIPLATRVDGKDIDTVSAHNDVVNAKGAVVFAKFGAPLVPGTIKTPNGSDQARDRYIAISRREKGWRLSRLQIPVICDPSR